MKTLYILPIEPIENRYPGDWYKYLPSQFEKYIYKTSEDYDIVSVDGEMTMSNTRSSEFLNFVDTNIWKSTQMTCVAGLFSAGKVKDGDVFLFTDAWNPSVHQLRYMAELTGKKIKIVGIWHAGSYDKADILGQKIKNKKWSYANEAAMYEAYDNNIFATQFHRNMFLHVLVSGGFSLSVEKSRVCGFPMEYMSDKFGSSNPTKADMVIFPHRSSPEKQHNIAIDLAEDLDKRGIEMYICQGKNLTIDQYHQKLQESKVCLSCSWQETLGIAQFEGMLAGSVPYVPDRLSYSEIYPSSYKYPSSWTNDFNSYLFHKKDILAGIEYNMSRDSDDLKYDAKCILDSFFTGTEFYGVVLDSICYV